MRIGNMLTGAAMSLAAFFNKAAPEPDMRPVGLPERPSKRHLAAITKTGLQAGAERLRRFRLPAGRSSTLRKVMRANAIGNSERPFRYDTRTARQRGV